MRRFLLCLRSVYREHGTLEALYRSGGGDPRARLARFLAAFRAAWGEELPRERNFLFPDPVRGSACKRANMFLRWMARPRDGVDLGVWRSVPPRDLIVPLDTHMTRLGRWLGFTRRRTADWRMAEEITAAFREFAPEDPVRYDYALTRIGILRECTGSRKGACGGCPLCPLCRAGENEVAVHPRSR